MISNVIKITQYQQDENLSVFTPLEEKTSPSAENTQQTIIAEALLKAKQIINSANEYCTTLTKNTKEHLNTECIKLKKEGFDEGYGKGFSEGSAAGNEKGLREGLEAGYRDGYAAGLKKADEENVVYTDELNKTLDELKSMMDEVNEGKLKILREFERDLIDLSVMIAEKIVKQEISLDTDLLARMVKNAVDSYRNQVWVRIIVSQNTAGALMSADGNLINALSAVSNNVKIIKSAGMSDSDCIAELPDRLIDLGADTQLENIKQVIKAALKRSEQENAQGTM
ncbi:MAG: FliH/SctL family protein [Bacillota bacterium]|nr:FliH/SctL family protein [Bacillota bacterium]